MDVNFIIQAYIKKCFRRVCQSFLLHVNTNKTHLKQSGVLTVFVLYFYLNAAGRGRCPCRYRVGYGSVYLFN